MPCLTDDVTVQCFSKTLLTSPCPRGGLAKMWPKDDVDVVNPWQPRLVGLHDGVYLGVQVLDWDVCVPEGR